MSYDPRVRGPHPVGVQTAELDRGDRPLSVEVWYPSVDRHHGADTDPGTRDAFTPLPGAPTTWQAAVRDAAPRLGTFPLVAFSHGLGGHRRQSTFLCTHLASHGYVVAAPDHVGTRAAEVLERAGRAGAAPELDDLSAARPGELDAAIDGLMSGTVRPVARSVNRERVAVIGHGLGAWTALAVTGRDPRVALAVALAPPGGSGSPAAMRLSAALEFDWGRVVPTLAVAAEADRIVPVASVRELLAQVRAPTRLAVLKNADHFHFCDQVERVHELFADTPLPSLAGGAVRLPALSELVPADRGYRVVRALCLAHLDAFFKGRDEAKDVLSDELASRIAGDTGDAADVEFG